MPYYVQLSLQSVAVKDPQGQIVMEWPDQHVRNKVLSGRLAAQDLMLFAVQQGRAPAGSEVEPSIRGLDVVTTGWLWGETAPTLSWTDRVSASTPSGPQPFVQGSYDPAQLQDGFKVEHEHEQTIRTLLAKHAMLLKSGTGAQISELIDSAIMSIASDHLREFRDYYTRLEKMERAAKAGASPYQLSPTGDQEQTCSVEDTVIGMGSYWIWPDGRLTQIASGKHIEYAKKHLGRPLRSDEQDWLDAYEEATGVISLKTYASSAELYAMVKPTATQQQVISELRQRFAMLEERGKAFWVPNMTVEVHP